MKEDCCRVQLVLSDIRQKQLLRHVPAYFTDLQLFSLIMQTFPLMLFQTFSFTSHYADFMWGKIGQLNYYFGEQVVF